ncbi:DUF1659 domain-containing protein [Soehngenia longivitae]|jgi:hypothetical protein|uniref:DUF1659 domain-containing protein n=1 Tax=Soehngenia longivitae TaxID=2562294 RepID=A0A4Z0D967_9FIRM|nr:DUF1659 domain-containing protein [Soehngenia longivitae]TFZ41448.1 DUF1659 domain-containing protein [Soehngenia longivitae]
MVEITKKSLKLELDGGVVDGKQKIDSKTYSNISLSATDENILSAGELISGLQEKALINVKRIEEAIITE